MKFIVPTWVKIWLVASALICFLDAFYVLNRPQTLSGGSLYHIFFFYQNYVKFDTLYGQNNDSFVVIQSWLNIVQSVIALVIFIMLISKCIKIRLTAAIMAIVIEAFIFWKTVIFVWYDNDFLTKQALQFTPMSILCYYIPSSVWIFTPIFAIISISRKIIQVGVRGQNNKISQKMQKKTK